MLLEKLVAGYITRNLDQLVCDFMNKADLEDDSDSDSESEDDEDEDRFYADEVETLMVALNLVLSSICRALIRVSACYVMSATDTVCGAQGHADAPCPDH